MDVDKFAQKVEFINRRLAVLQRLARELPPKQQEFLGFGLKEFSTALKELQMAEHELAAARQAAKVERQRYQDLFEFAPDGYLVTDMTGTIQEANYAAAALLNSSQQFLAGLSLLIFITAEEERRAFRFILKRLQQSERAQEWDVRLHPRQGRPFDAAITAAPVRDCQGKPIALRICVRNITKRKQLEEQLLHDAFHDQLTGLPNRALFMNRLSQAIQRTKRYRQSSGPYLFAVLFLDLDRFKVINDSLGHTVGDQLLRAIACRLETCMRPGDTIARLGGDEFTILLDDIKDASSATHVAERIHKELTLPFNLGGHEVFTTASIGIVLSIEGGATPESLLRNADTAMYRAKVLGKSRYEVFDTEMHTRAVTLLQLETDLRRAIERQEFQIHYQPIVSLETGRIAGFEALVRWQHPQRGLVSPAEFIPLAEETGLIIPIGQWVLREACYQMRTWQMQFPTVPPLLISVNLSVKQFSQQDLVEQIDQILRESGLDARSLKLEITESVIMENVEAATAKLSQLQALDIQLCVDDFGTGYSSLSYLHRFPINALKIDRSFVLNMGIKGEKWEIVRAIAALAQNLSMDMTAEGVEVMEQLAQLKVLKCKHGQGYLFSKPVNSEVAGALIAARPQW